MAKHTQFLERLRAQGLRLTPQRILILSVIAQGNSHMGVDQIHRASQEVYPYIDLATVYRTLHLFKKLGVVTEVGMGDRLHFELTGPDTKHHHMVCQQCGRAFDLSPVYLRQFQTTLKRRFGFEPDLQNFTVTGTCSACSSSGPTKKREV